MFERITYRKLQITKKLEFEFIDIGVLTREDRQVF
jgi:hypothetical protein